MTGLRIGKESRARIPIWEAHSRAKSTVCFLPVLTIFVCVQYPSDIPPVHHCSAPLGGTAPRPPPDCRHMHEPPHAQLSDRRSPVQSRYKSVFRPAECVAERPRLSSGRPSHARRGANRWSHFLHEDSPTAASSSAP